MVPSSKRSRKFIIFFTVATAFICAFIIYKDIFQTTLLSQANFRKPSAFHSKKLSDCRSVCTTEDCLHIANLILDSMDQSAEPCENFHSFACGGILEKLGKNTNYSMFQRQDEYMLAVVKDIIEKSNGPPGSSTEKLKAVYDSCINDESSELKSVQTFLKFLDEIGIHNWPNLNSDFTFKNPSLEEVLGKLQSYREKMFFVFRLPPRRFREPGIVNLSIYEQYNYRDNLLNSEETKYLVYEILNHLDTDNLTSNQIVEDYLDIETSIQKLQKENIENSEKICESFPVERTLVNCTEETVGDEGFICNVMKSYIRNIQAENFVNLDDYRFSCRSSYYVENIISLMGNYSHRALANYMALKIFMNNFEFMKLSLRRKLKVFFQIETFSYRTGRLFEMDKYKFCLKYITNQMQYSLALLYIPQIFPGNAVEDVQGIFTEVINSIVNVISQQEWIEETKRDNLLEAVRKIDNEFYNAATSLNETKLNEIYQKFEFNPSKDDFFRNVLEAKRFMTLAFSSGFEEYFLMDMPFEVEASYGGTLSIGLGFLLPPFYKYSMDKLFNSAITAQVLGHEVGHMIYYYLREDTDNKTQDTFKEKLSCLMDQYSKFYIESIGKHLKGNKTVGENFPDYLARIVTEKIVIDYLTNMTQKLYLPGMPYSGEELLYLAYSQLWCIIRSTEKEQRQYEEDYHSPPQFRVLGAFQNSEKFSQVFNCKPNSFMNPEDKCIVFDT